MERCAETEEIGSEALGRLDDALLEVFQRFAMRAAD